MCAWSNQVYHISYHFGIKMQQTPAVHARICVCIQWLCRIEIEYNLILSVCVCVCVCMCACVCVCVCMSPCVFVCACQHMCGVPPCACMSAYTYMYMCVCTCVYAFMRDRVCVCVCMCVHIYRCSCTTYCDENSLNLCTRYKCLPMYKTLGSLVIQLFFYYYVRTYVLHTVQLEMYKS